MAGSTCDIGQGGLGRGSGGGASMQTASRAPDRGGGADFLKGSLLQKFAVAVV